MRNMIYTADRISNHNIESNTNIKQEYLALHQTQGQSVDTGQSMDRTGQEGTNKEVIGLAWYLLIVVHDFRSFIINCRKSRQGVGKAVKPTATL